MEIKIFLNENGTNEIKDSVEFEKVIAGKTNQRSLFIKNIIIFPLNVEVSLIGEDIKLTKAVKNILPQKTKEIIFKLTPKLTAMKPIKAKLKLKIGYIVR